MRHLKPVKVGSVLMSSGRELSNDPHKKESANGNA